MCCLRHDIVVIGRIESLRENDSDDDAFEESTPNNNNNKIDNNGYSDDNNTILLPLPSTIREIFNIFYFFQSSDDIAQ